MKSSLPICSLCACVSDCACVLYLRNICLHQSHKGFLLCFLPEVLEFKLRLFRNKYCLFNFKNWSITDLQHYAGSRCATQWFNISISCKIITTVPNCLWELGSQFIEISPSLFPRRPAFSTSGTQEKHRPQCRRPTRRAQEAAIQCWRGPGHAARVCNDGFPFCPNVLRAWVTIPALLAQVRTERGDGTFILGSTGRGGGVLALLSLQKPCSSQCLRQLGVRKGWWESAAFAAPSSLQSLSIGVYIFGIPAGNTFFNTLTS